MTTPPTPPTPPAQRGPGWTEATITVNGHALTFGQSMTVRVALENMAMDLTNEGLGDDAHGNYMTQAYLDRIREIRGMMQK